MKSRFSDPNSDLNMTIRQDLDPENITFGDFEGTPWARLPIWYLRELVAEGDLGAEKARKQLEYRGVPEKRGKVYVTLHAVDRFFLRLEDVWKNRPDKRVGIAAYLTQLAEKADNLRHRNNIFLYNGIRFIFKETNGKTYLTTVIEKKKDSSDANNASKSNSSNNASKSSDTKINSGAID